jgi:hypothetical protein
MEQVIIYVYDYDNFEWRPVAVNSDGELVLVTG